MLLEKDLQVVLQEQKEDFLAEVYGMFIEVSDEYDKDGYLEWSAGIAHTVIEMLLKTATEETLADVQAELDRLYRYYKKCKEEDKEERKLIKAVVKGQEIDIKTAVEKRVAVEEKLKKLVEETKKTTTKDDLLEKVLIQVDLEQLDIVIPSMQIELEVAYRTDYITRTEQYPEVHLVDINKKVEQSLKLQEVLKILKGII